ncbi:aa3-type cytochrome c oxidase subunit IV [Alphaproteobacteria bacterium KMM 3653]|uniref:Aa3-type cytochrome c oxidase subunit IV n=1 Tax=Harenicola maris TaxID=2841044 RepID=A0AAP2CQ32_9RHOB|nr:aa3-type cytochrome c oxidase subunit IV [Harenicola maris]
MSDEHKHGEMDITVQEKTFEGFIRYVTYGGVFCICLLIFIYAVNG